MSNSSKEKMRKWIKCKKDRFLKSKFLVFVLGLVIGGTSLIILYEAPPLIKYITEGYSYSTKFLQIRANQGQDSESLPDPAEDSYVEEKESTPIPPSISKIVDKVYQLESSSGKNDQKCERLGKHNGYGFGQWEGHNTCFSSDDETREQVIKWFENKLKVMTLEEALKLYSGDSLSYVSNFNNLNV